MGFQLEPRVEAKEVIGGYVIGGGGRPVWLEAEGAESDCLY